MAKKPAAPKKVTPPKLDGPLMWDSPQLREHHARIEEVASDLGNVRTNIDRSIAVYQKSLDSAPAKAAAGKALKPSTIKKNHDEIASLSDLRDRNLVHDRPMTIDNMADTISGKFDDTIDDARRRSAITGRRELPRGAAWYFDHNEKIHGRGETRLDTHHMAKDTPGLMAAAVSPKNEPDRERTTARALVNLDNPTQGPEGTGHTVRYTKAGISGVGKRTREPFDLAHSVNHPYRNLNPNQIAATASHAAEESSKIKAGKMSERARSVTSTGPIGEAGLANQRQIETAARLGRGDPSADPFDDYDAATKPKTYAHGKHATQSRSGSLAHLDYLNIAHHVTHEDPNQTMMQFSPEITERTGTLPHALQPKAPVAIDTWMQGQAAGQEARGTRQAGVGGYDSNRGMSPSKRVSSEGAHPVSSSWMNKETLGLPDDPNVTPAGVLHAYINEGIHQAAARHGHVSHNQFGDQINLPSSLVHETVWTNARVQAGDDPDHSREQKEWNSAVKNEKKAAKFTADSGIKKTGLVAGTPAAERGAKADAAKIAKDRAHNETPKGQANPRAIPTGFQDQLF